LFIATLNIKRTVPPILILHDETSEPAPTDDKLSSSNASMAEYPVPAPLPRSIEPSYPGGEGQSEGGIAPIMAPPVVSSAIEAETETSSFPPTPDAFPGTSNAVFSPAMVPIPAPIASTSGCVGVGTSTLGDGVLTTTAEPPMGNASASSKPKTVPQEFNVLVEELKQHGNRATRSVVGNGLMKRDPLTYQRAHLTGSHKFKKYVTRAVEAGIVSESLQWISLNPTWY
jgi:hypothetical protein